MLTGIVEGERVARDLCKLIENVKPAPTGVGFFELNENRDLWEVEAYFKKAPALIPIFLFDALFNTSLKLTKLTDTNWVTDANKNLEPIALGSIFIHGSHCRSLLQPNKKNIEIEAAMAFGTGHHSTTIGAIALYLKLIKEGKKFRHVVDIGCGTGILSIVAAKTSGATVRAVDKDDVAVITARQNFVVNRLPSGNMVFRCEGLRDARFYGTVKFDLIFANILFRPLKDMVKSLAFYCKPGGFIILSGISYRQSRLIQKCYEGHAFNRYASYKDGNWVSLVFRRCHPFFPGH